MSFLNLRSLWPFGAESDATSPTKGGVDPGGEHSRSRCGAVASVRVWRVTVALMALPPPPRLGRRAPDELTPSTPSRGEDHVDLAQLDLTFITENLLISGLPWRGRTEKRAHRNNIHDLARVLEELYGSHYLLFNYAPVTAPQYDASKFNYQVPCPHRERA